MGKQPLRLLYDIFPRLSPGMPTTLDAPVIFGGYCAPGTLGDARGKMVVCYGWNRAGLTRRGDRLKAVEQAGAVGMLELPMRDSREEPTRWPMAYARAVAPVGAPAPAAITAAGHAQCRCAGAGHRGFRP